MIDNALAVDFGGGVFQPTAFGVVKSIAEHYTLNVIGQQSLNVFAHVVGIRLAGLWANVKGGDTLVAMLGQFRFDALSLILGIGERSPADRN